MALKGDHLGLRHLGRLGPGIDATRRTPRRVDATRGDIDPGSVIAHGIGVGRARRQAPRGASTATAATLLLAVGVATGRASPIAPSYFGEVKAPALGGAAACAVPLPSVAGATDRKLSTAPTAQLETDGVNASPMRVFALRVAARLLDFGVAHHVCRHHPNDQIELDADVQRSAPSVAAFDETARSSTRR